MTPHAAPAPQRAPQDQRTRARLLLSHRYLRFLLVVLSACQALYAWLQGSTIAPCWLPARWRHPWIGYLLALFSSTFAAGVTLLLALLFPELDIKGVLLIGGIVLVALFCGAGPSLLATIVSIWLLEFVVLPPHTPWQLSQAGAWVDGGIHLVSWMGISLLASQSGWARRRAEALADALKKAQASSDLERLRLRALVEALPAPVAMVDTQGRLVEANPAIRQFLGEAAPVPREMTDFALLKGWRPATGQPLDFGAWALARALRAGEPVTWEEVEIETFDGQRKSVLDSATPIRDERGVVHGAVGILLDITERKQLEDALRQAEQEAAARARELEAIVEALTDGLLVYDAQGRILRCNSAARQLLGFERHPEFASLPWKERAARYASLDAAGQPIPQENLALDRLLRGEILSGAQTAEDLLHTPDGREVSFSMTGRPLRNAEGAIIGAVGIARDVTERRLLEQHTREMLNALLAMAESLVQVQREPDAAAPLGAAGPSLRADPSVLAVARRLAELTRSVLGCQHVSMAAVEPETGALTPITTVGLAPEQEPHWWASWDEASRLAQYLPPDSVAALCAGESIVLKRTDLPLHVWQERCLVQTSRLTPMRMGETLVGLLRVDLGREQEEDTRRKEAALTDAVARLGALVLERERLLRERTEARASELALRETQAHMETFLGMAGHELKNPLTSIKLSLQLIERRLSRLVQHETSGTHDLTTFLEQIGLAGRQAGRLERLVNELLDISRARVGKLDLHLASSDLAAIVGEGVEEQRQAHPERALIFQLPAGVRVPVRADADRIGQVVTNYLTNALKYSPATRAVEVGLDVGEQQARVWVRDEGPGLPAEERERIWERFHRVKGIEVQSGTGVGLGLGLHICRTIIERHQGQVGVESVPGQGSTFWFTLPLCTSLGEGTGSASLLPSTDHRL